ncbi:NXPE family member 3-like isoform X2 [Epinephelus lanceolatus]|uniref:NXPE family member 3-like isoform X2 n=1 Tax=Epinephelus lanceolatus TaxID=310571 RepID=UPI0014489EC8|nr:NXPE family member 3-like isoform X2 [Epinephelus lanceolatus]
MTLVACARREYSAIFLFLAVAVVVFVLHNMEILQKEAQGSSEGSQQGAGSNTTDSQEASQFQNKANSTIIYPSVPTAPDINHGLCKFQPLPPEDAQEERHLIDLIAWPETPLLPNPFRLEETSDPAHSTFTILPRRGGGQWRVGDQLEVMIKISDFKGRPKKSGGDFLLARLNNPNLAAGVAGQVVDHLNGSYSAVLSLLWEGRAQVEVMLVHSSEAITVLTRLNVEQPDRMRFQSTFRAGSVSETTTCNVCLRQPQYPLCNFTDPRTGEPWFCYKPKSLNCDTRMTHGTERFVQDIKSGEETLFQSDINMKVYIKATGPSAIDVFPKEEGQPQVKSSIETSGLFGYYHQGVWRALDGTAVRQFDTPATIQCLRSKEVHIFGDSTVRQWFEFITSVIPDLKEIALYNPGKAGPHMSVDHVNKILVMSRFHGVPIRINSVSSNEVRFAASEIDGLIGGPNTVVVIGIWAHFGTFPIEVYIRRMQSVRRAVVRLLNRAPATKVIIRTGNPKALTLFYALTNSDWYTLQIDKVLRTMFKGMNVHWVYAWEMVMAHQLPHNLHPLRPIIKDMIGVLLSYVCPK